MAETAAIKGIYGGYIGQMAGSKGSGGGSRSRARSGSTESAASTR